jgi:hypothetical protein
MSQVVANEPSTSGFGAAWNAFWFTPSTGRRIGVLRCLVGFTALLYLALWSVDLERFLSRDGVLPPSAISTAISADPLYYPWRFSLLDYLPNRSALWGFHIAAIAAASLCMLGIASRWTTALTFIAVLSYVHRAPLLMSPVEPLLVWSLLYLSLSPCGNCFSLDYLWSKAEYRPTTSENANISLRLIQLHLCLHYFFVATTQLSDSSWWSGNAVWILMAQSRTRGLDLTALRESTFLINGVTHLLVFLAFALALGPWNRSFRSIVNWLVIPYAIIVAALTGLWVYAFLLLFLQIAFCDEERLGKLLARFG